jgi:phosphoheptose isomerase
MFLCRGHCREIRHFAQRTDQHRQQNRPAVEPLERVAYHFQQSRQTGQAALQMQATPIDAASRRIVEALMGGGKILTCGTGRSGADAIYLAIQMQHRCERPRPGLPAVALNADANLITALAAEDGIENIYARQINALGHPGDVLVAISAEPSDSSQVTAIEAARDRRMTIVALTGADDPHMPALLDPGDIEIVTPSNSTPRVLENHRLVMHCLCDLIDMQLMGS